MNNSTIPHLLDIPHVPADLTTKEFVNDLVGMCDLRAACTKEDLVGVICAVLSMRGLKEFKIAKKHDRLEFSKGQKAAIDQITRHLVGTLINRVSGTNVYRVTPKLNRPTKVRADLPNEFPFRVTSEYATYPSTKAVPCAEAVSLISNNRACTLTMPDVALTFEYLLNEMELPTHIGRLESLPNIDAGRTFTKMYKKEVHAALSRSGYLGFLLDDDNDEALTFVVCSQYAAHFSTYLETVTRHFFRQYKLDLLKFYAEVEDRFGSVAKIEGQPTFQLLRQSAGLDTLQQ